MKKIVLVLSLIFFFTVSSSVKAQWEIVPSGTTQGLRSIFFADSLHGYIAGLYGVILKSIDGGLNWQQQISGTLEHYSSIFFVDSNYGWACGGKVISMTTNGGINWLSREFPAFSFADIRFINRNNGIVVGYYEDSYHEIFSYAGITSNGGQNWNQIVLPRCWGFQGVFYTSDSCAFIIGDGVIYRTSNGGNSWLPVHTSPLFRGSDIDFCSSDLGVVVGEGGSLKKTLNAGLTWDQTNNSNLGWLYNVDIIDSSFIVAINGSNKVLYTLDMGHSWSHYNEIDSFNIANIFFSNKNNGWAVGRNGIILHTTNSGVTFIDDERVSNVQPTEFTLSQNYPNPFNPSTIISYQLSAAGDVSLKVYDLLGREVATLVNEYKNAGSYEVELNANNLPNGVYFYRLIAGDYVETKKMVLLK